MKTPIQAIKQILIDSFNIPKDSNLIITQYSSFGRYRKTYKVSVETTLFVENQIFEITIQKED